MRQASLYAAAKAQLSELVQSAHDGDWEGIVRAGKPLVQSVGGTPSSSLCGRGSLRLDPASIDSPLHRRGGRAGGQDVSRRLSGVTTVRAFLLDTPVLLWWRSR